MGPRNKRIHAALGQPAMPRRLPVATIDTSVSSCPGPAAPLSRLTEALLLPAAGVSTSAGARNRTCKVKRRTAQRMRLVLGGVEVYRAIIYRFLRRKIRIGFLAFMAYLALC